MINTKTKKNKDTLLGRRFYFTSGDTQVLCYYMFATYHCLSYFVIKSGAMYWNRRKC